MFTTVGGYAIYLHKYDLPTTQNAGYKISLYQPPLVVSCLITNLSSVKYSTVETFNKL